MNWSSNEILRTWDRCCTQGAFPILGAKDEFASAWRLFLFRSPSAWAMVIEVFGYSAQAGVPRTAVYSFGNELQDRPGPENFINDYAWQEHRKLHPCDEVRFIYPVEDGPWQQDELVREGAEEVVVRGAYVAIPGTSGADPLRVADLCDYLARTRRDLVLCQPEELVVNLSPEMQLLLKKDSWVHPEIEKDQKPSDSADFLEFARLLAGETD